MTLLVTSEFISGVMFGFEIVSHEELGEEEGVTVVLDLFIVRLLFSFYKG